MSITAHLGRLDQAGRNWDRQPGGHHGGERVMDSQTLREELESRGLTVLGVGQHRTSPDVLIVYLHGNEGQWVDGAARQVISGVEGVLTVIDSVQSPTILLVRTGRPSS